MLHAAGLLRDMMHTRMSASDLTSVFAPKACGAAHLHAATQHAPLGSMVYYSSAASAFGSAGQANYAAANAYLDSLGGCRNAVGTAAVCLQVRLTPTPTPTLTPTPTPTLILALTLTLTPSVCSSRL